MLKRLSIVSVAVIILCLGAFALKASKAKNVDTKKQQPGVTIRNNTVQNKWSNVPIQISFDNGTVYQVRNTSALTIKRFNLVLYCAHMDAPLHGPDSDAHRLEFHWGDREDRTLKAGESTQVNIEAALKVFASTDMSDMTRIEIWPLSVEFDGAQKKWFGGKFYTKTTGKWEADVSLKSQPSPRIAGPCYVYNPNVENGSKFCTNPDSGCSGCRYQFPQFMRAIDGVQLRFVCTYCMHVNADGTCCSNSTCQRANGSACAQSGVNDLDYDHGC